MNDLDCLYCGHPLEIVDGELKHVEPDRDAHKAVAIRPVASGAYAVSKVMREGR